MKQIEAIFPYLQNKNSLSFQADTCDAFKRNGVNIKKGIRIPLKIQYLIAKLKITFNIFESKRKAYITFGGGSPDYSIFPYCYLYEMIPMLWDCWPQYHTRLFQSIKRNRIKTIIVTSSQIAEILKRKYPNLNVIYIPEGIDITKYRNEKKLIDRKIDLLEFGRPYKKFHDKIISSIECNNINHYFSNNGWIFPDSESFINGLSETKVAITLPRCDTHPEIAGNIETLTQRYWECMLSGCIMLGKAPMELINLIGYNPVVELNLENSDKQVKDILININNYQSLVDKNFKVALKYASWDNRVIKLKNELKKLNYKF